MFESKACKFIKITIAITCFPILKLSHKIAFKRLCYINQHEQVQWRNDAPGAPATPGGAVLRGRQIVIKCGTILQD